MALVAYDYGSESENEEDPDETLTPSAVVIPSAENSPSHDKTAAPETSTDKISDILSQLPQTKDQDQKSPIVNNIEDKLEDFIPKYEPTKEKKPQKVRITIPALSEFAEEDEPPQKRKKVPKSKGSTLLSMLPAVRGTPLTTKSFIPNVLKNKPPVQKKANSLVPHAVRKKAEEAKMAAIKKITRISAAGSDAESDVDDIEIPETFDDEIWQKVCGPRSRAKPQVIEEPEEPVYLPTIDIAPEPVKPYDGLDNAAFKELVGKSKRPVNIKLIDINEEELVADKDEWMMKALTDPDYKPKPSEEEDEEDPLDPTRKKKHHITYLAQQAKANEQELQGQWSANKFARNQTRAKYGF